MPFLIKHAAQSVRCLLWLLACLCVLDAHADDVERVRQQLAELKTEIEAIQARIRAAEQQRDTLDDQLARTEREISSVTRELKRLQTAIARQTDRLGELDREQAALDQQIGTQHQALIAQARSAYALGQNQLLKMVINQDDPQAVGRSMAYYRFFNQLRLEQISRIRAQLLRVAELAAEELRVSASLEADEQRLISERDNKQALAAQRKVLLEDISQQIRSSQSQLGSLNQDQQRLQSLLEQLQDIFADIPEQIDNAPEFDALKGLLNWPIEGRMFLAPGKNKPGGMNRLGALIKADKGVNVRAVSYGRVAYSDWLRGFGLLTIVDHGDGYLSLYGFNEALLKDVGDWVGRDEIIATVGDNSLINGSGLYFELRHDGKTIDPRGWIRPAN